MIIISKLDFTEIRSDSWLARPGKETLGMVREISSTKSTSFFTLSPSFRLTNFNTQLNNKGGK